MAALRRGMLALVAAVIAPITARADELAVIRVFPPECADAPVSAYDFVDALRVELAGRQPHCCVVGPGGDPATDAVKVTLSIDPCDPATQTVDVSVDVGDPKRAMARQVSLSDLPPEARARALALAVAELIRSAGEPAHAEAPVVVEAPPPPPPFRLYPVGSIAAQLRSHPSRDTTLWGSRLGISLAAKRWQAALDVGVAVNGTAVSQGNVNILVADATLVVGPQFVLGPVIADVGPAFSFGRGWITGQSDDPNVGQGSGSGFVGTIGVRAGIEGPAARHIRLRVFGEGGTTLGKLDAIVDGEPATGISGPYFVLAVGVRFGPGP
jgi:hypothetical protein